MSSEFNIEDMKKKPEPKITEMSIAELRPTASKEDEPLKDVNVKEIVHDIEDTIIRKKMEFAFAREELREMNKEEEIEKEIGDLGDEVIASSNDVVSIEPDVKVEKTVKIMKPEDDIDKEIKSSEEEEIENPTFSEPEEYIDDVESDLDDELEDEESNLKDIEMEDNDPTEEEILATAKSSIKEHIKPVLNKIDLSSFTVSKKPVTIASTLRHLETVNTVTWAMYNSKIALDISLFAGPEVAKLRPSRNTYREYDSMFRIIYNHIQNKGTSTYESWRSTFNFYDLSHLFFAIYKATFSNANYVPFDCPECKHSWVEEVDIDKMVKYVDKNAEKVVEEILNMPPKSISDKLEVERIQISDDYCIDLKCPSIYEAAFQPTLLDREFIEKYSENISDVSHIDAIYYIDRENMALRPLEIKKYEGDEVKTLKSTIVRYTKFLNSLGSDQYNTFKSYIDALYKKSNDVYYVYPETKCPKCGATVEEVQNDPSTMLFTRHQLVTIANS